MSDALLPDDHTKMPRLYVDVPVLEGGASAFLPAEAVHYLHAVMRKSVGDGVRVFNGRDGEWLVRIVAISKRACAVQVEAQILAQPEHNPGLHLIFAPLKKNRMDMVIEKCTELGVTDFHPVITNRTEVRVLKEERVSRQIIEAAEQCERLEIPALHPIVRLEACVRGWAHTDVVLAGLERGDASFVSPDDMRGDVAFLIGPVGGFDEGEHKMLAGYDGVRAISLGAQILRAETASMMCAALALSARAG